MTERVFCDGSQLVAQGALHAGVDFFVGYPITPASGIFAEMMRSGVGIAAPDEITALQYLIGAALNGRKAMTATSGPGFLLMAEGLGAALMMEVPLVVVLVQRLGPATGSATMNAQGDLGLAAHAISGGFVMPLLCPARIEQCGEMTAHAVRIAETLRVPVVLLTEKDMVVGKRTIDRAAVDLPAPVSRRPFQGDAAVFSTYAPLDERDVPYFRPLFDPEVQLRVTASTHDGRGMIASFSERVRHNTERLQVDQADDVFVPARFDRQDDACDLVISYGFTDYAAREAVARLRAAGRPVSHLTVHTLLPVLRAEFQSALQGVTRVILPEENLTGQYRQLLQAHDLLAGREIVSLTLMGRPIAPEQIERAVYGTQEVRS